MVETMTRARLCLGIDLQCLSRPSCHQFVQAMLPDVRVSDDQLEEIYLRSRGNPLFAGELIREIRRCNGMPRSGAGRRDQSGGAERVPAHARARIAMRLGTMDETLRRVLGLAAASETEVSLNELRAGAAALEPPVLGRPLDALVPALQMSLLEECRTGYAFRHPLVRSAVYDCLPRHRRDEFHAAITASRRPGTFGKTTGSALESRRTMLGRRRGRESAARLNWGKFVARTRLSWNQIKVRPVSVPGTSPARKPGVFPIESGEDPDHWATWGAAAMERGWY